MPSFLFGTAKLAFLKDLFTFRSTSFGIVPVEATPSTGATDYGAITGIATDVGGGSLVKPLLDIGGNPANRVLNDTANNRVALRFAPVDWGALATTNAAPITGFVVVNNIFPASSSIPIFYIELVDGGGAPLPFTPNGVDFLTINLTENPVGIREYGGNVFDAYLLGWISESFYPSSAAFSIIYCESAPDPTWITVADITTGRATLPGGDDLSSALSDIGNSTNNRSVWVGDIVNGTAGYQFETVIMAAFETGSQSNVTHYILAENKPPSAGSRLAGWGLINPALVATGVNDYRLNMIAGSTLTL